MGPLNSSIEPVSQPVQTHSQIAALHITLTLMTRGVKLPGRIDPLTYLRAATPSALKLPPQCQPWVHVGKLCARTSV